MIKLPIYSISLHIEHNTHKVYYETLPEYIRTNNIEFDNKEEYDKSIELDSLWEITWYPDTPIGSYSVYSYSLENCLKKAEKVNTEHD